MKKALKNNLFILKCIYKSGARALFCIVFFIVAELLTYYLATNQGMWILDSIDVVDTAKIVLLVGCMYVSVALLDSVGNWMSMYTIPIAVTKVGEYLTGELIDKIFDIRQKEVENPEFYDKYSRAVAEIDERPGTILSLVKSIIGSFLELILIISIASSLNWRFTVVFVLASLAKTVISIVINEVEYKRYEERTVIDRKLSYVNRVIYQPEYGELLRNNGGYRGLLRNYYSHNIMEYCSLVKKYHPKLYMLWILNEIIETFCFRLGPWMICIISLANGSMTMGQVTVIMNAINFLPAICLKLFGSIVDIRKQSLFIENLRYVLEYKVVRTRKQLRNKTKEGPNILEVENASFSYGTDGKLVLRGVNSEIRYKEKIALVGANGAGKSTLAKILSGLYSPTEGRCYLMGLDIDKWSLDDINKHIIMINQNTFMLSLTIAENIMQRPLTSIEDYVLVEEALKKVGMYEKVSKFKNGVDSYYSTEFDENGVVLSGGEKQKIAIARVYVSNAEVVILDEPTSALDAFSEREINHLLFNLLADRTVITISHRFSFMKQVDTIFYMENGKIVERGSHEELMRLNGGYSRLYMAQASRYIEIPVVECELPE